MSEFINTFKRNVRLISVILLYIVCGFIIYLFSPKEGRFKYEIPLNEPWLYSDLTAPFDFPIHKSEQEIKREQDSLLKYFSPYFKYNEKICLEQQERLTTDFTTSIIDFTLREFNIRNERLLKNNRRYKYLYENINSWQDYLNYLFDRVYQKGIIDLTPLPENEKISTINLIKSNQEEEIPIEEVFEPKAAYDFIISGIQEKFSQTNNTYLNRFKNFFNEFDVNNYIKVNVTYDKNRSEVVKQTMLSEISPTRNIVQKDEIIVEKNQLVDSEIHQKILSLKAEYEQLGFNASEGLRLGKFLVILVSLFVIFLFLYNLRRDTLLDIQKTLFILLLIIIFSVSSSYIIKSIGRSPTLTKEFIYFFPFAILPILLRTFYDERLSLFIHFVITMLVGFLAQNSYEFVFITFIVGIIAVFSLKNVYRRSKIVVASALIVLTYIFVFLSLSLVGTGGLNDVSANKLLWFGVNGVLILLAYPLIYIFEKSFGFISDATLFELSDTNQPLLRALAEKAPGTFQHSLQVANLAEEAIHKIGGNSLLIRTGALYHDIGKMDNPIYFIENQSSEFNPHDNLTFEESAKTIISHVEKGVEMAKRNNLPEPIINCIKTHHGTTTVQYFYRSYIKKYPNEDVDMKNFSYSGPKPSSKETAVLMMADSIEAASRSLKNYEEKTIEKLVDNIINSQLIEEQFSNANITFKDITTIKEVFKKRLKDIYHVRISYPSNQ